MSSTTLPHRAASALPRGALGHPAVSLRPSPVAPLVVALAGGGDDAAVVTAARALAERLQAPPVVVSVLDGDHGARASALRRTLGEESGWPVEIAHGPVAHALARVTTRRGARMLVMGASHHGTWDQLVGAETSLHVLREADRPVLVVARTFGALPRRVVVATDFEMEARRVAAEALALLPPGGTLVLVHVVRRAVTRQPPHARRVDDLLDELAARLDPPAGVSVVPIVLSGDPASEILAYAAATDAELIATGTSGARFGQRMYVGGVATTLLRRAPCSVLVSPP